MTDFEDRLVDQHAKLIQKGFFIEKVTRPISLDTDPQDGFEFIHKSRLEDALLDYGPKKETSKSPTPENQTENSTDNLTIWGREQGLQFMHLAHKIKNNKKSLTQKFPKKLQFPEIPRNPSDLDEKEWCAFCLGSRMCGYIFNADPPSHIKSRKPLLSIILHLDRRQLLQLICWLHKWFKVLSEIGELNHLMVDSICMWTYALCCNIHKPLDSAYEKQLEELHDSYKESLVSLEGSSRDRVYLIVAILKHYFGVKYFENSLEHEWNTYIDPSYYCLPSSSSEHSD